MMRRIPGTMFAVVWLFLLHGLADGAVAICRSHDVHRALTDVLSAALPRSQLLLLIVWLVVGAERLSWRVSGLFGGSCFIFLAFSRSVFPGQYDISTSGSWLAEEWAFYFRLSAPGDFLVKMPVLLAGTALPLCFGRLAHELRGRRPSEPLRSRWRRGAKLQFRLQDAAVWSLSLCAVLAAAFRTAPYTDWFRQLFERWRQSYDVRDPAAVYSVSSAGLYVLIAFVAIWCVYGKGRFVVRVSVATALAAGMAFALERWLQTIVERATAAGTPPIRFQSSAETAIAVIAAVTMAASLLLYRLYGLHAAEKGPPFPRLGIDSSQ